MFTQYSLPYTYNFANRFKTGEMPIGIADYATYNQMILFATEIAGLWEMVPIPGIEDPETGEINNVALASVGSIVLPAGCRSLEASWDLMDWWVDKEFQVDYSNELVAVMGPAAKNTTANREALEELPWSSSEYRNLELQMNNLDGIVSYPGSYIIARYTNFAFLDAYNDLADPVDSLLNYINVINKEITRKRTEFDYETLEIGQTLAEKRSQQAVELTDALSGYETEIAAAKNAILAEDAAALKAAADAFLKAGSSDEIVKIAEYLRVAANCYETYALYE
jgi:ABC-type glycerol-3-phosphate transport system substrate-binding protein